MDKGRPTAGRPRRRPAVVSPARLHRHLLTAPPARWAARVRAGQVRRLGAACRRRDGAEPAPDAQVRLASAFDDKRFAPITLSEVQLLNCSVSLLMDFEDGRDCLDWQVGHAGTRCARARARSDGPPEHGTPPPARYRRLACTAFEYTSRRTAGRTRPPTCRRWHRNKVGSGRPRRRTLSRNRRRRLRRARLCRLDQRANARVPCAEERLHGSRDE